ncbi:alpha/beta fold hydrolase [Nocardia sp. CDC160]|uniref:alpha/beta fold hydrolase n=1 Tax=Nocardia sp. CDC160 TaxID=3112166 RepID=UPI002DBE29C7|nr:alpha/beta hydrolase [Nocardia sp. CDC160]MEC3917808.1 alpha/beta hydrolase [Nocardia sp. CDC160]
MSRNTESVESADGTRIVFHTQGSGPPLVIVHGALVTLDMYRHLADLLSTHHRVVLIERRDYGPSGNGPRPAGFAAQAADLAAVLDTVGEPAFVFGHSMGGLVALHAMHRDPSKVRRLALYEPPVVLAGPPLAPTLASIRELMDDNQPAEAIIEFFTAILDSAPPRSVLLPLGEALASRAPGLVVDLECLTTMATDITPWSTIALPTLLLSGELTDTYGTKSIALLHTTLPNTQTTTLPGEHHNPDNPESLAAALRDFFS